MARKRATINVKRVRFYRAYGRGVETPDYATALGKDPNSPSWHPIAPDMLRYDLSFVRDEDPTLIATVKFSNGYGGDRSYGRWNSFNIKLRVVRKVETVEEGARVTQGLYENWNGGDLYEMEQNVKTGGDWFTYMREPTTDGTLGELRRVPLTELLKLHRDQRPSEAANNYLTVN